MWGHRRWLAFHALEPPNPTYPQAKSMTPSALATARAQRRALQTCDVFVPRGLLPLGLWNVLLPTRERVIRKGDVRVVFVIPRLAMPWGPVWKTKARQEWPARQNTLANWPWAKAGCRPEPDPTLAGRIKAGGA